LIVTGDPRNQARPQCWEFSPRSPIPGADPPFLVTACQQVSSVREDAIGVAIYAGNLTTGQILNWPGCGRWHRRY